MISGNMVGSYSQLGKTLVLEDEQGNAITGVIVGQEVIFDATPDDVKIGKTFASDEGVAKGIDTRTYRTTQSNILIWPGESYSIPLSDYDKWDYTKLQCVIAKFNTSSVDSTSANKVVLNDTVYAVNSAEALSDVVKNSESKLIFLGIVNDTEDLYMIHYFTYKEEL